MFVIFSRQVETILGKSVLERPPGLKRLYSKTMSLNSWNHTHRLHCCTEQRTHFFMPCPSRTLGRIETMLHSDRFGLAYDSSPFRLVFGHPYQVPADHINPSQRSSTWPSSLSLWSASQELLLGAMVGHPLHMA